MTPDEEEIIRHKIASAILRSGYDEFDGESEIDLTEWHECYDNMNCAVRNDTGPCPCSGVPYLSTEVWEYIKPVLLEYLPNLLSKINRAEN
jgi:hypothetical protein